MKKWQIAAMFYFYNHRNETSPNFRGNVGGVTCLNVEALPDTVAECDDLIKATHGAVHLDEDEMRALNRSWESNAVNLILLRVSEGGRENLIGGRHVRWTKLVGHEERQAFILNVRDYSALTRATLKEFCSLTIEQAGEVFSEKLGSLPLRLKGLFTRKSTHYLVALDLLCQAYYLAHPLVGNPLLTELQVESTELGSWWMRCLGVKCLDDLEVGLRAEDVNDDLLRIAQGVFRQADGRICAKGIEALRDALKSALL